MKTKIILASFLVLSLLSFAKNTTYYLDEPKCSANWNNSGDNLYNKINLLDSILDEQQIEYSNTHVSVVYGLYQSCESCACLSGYRYYVESSSEYTNALATLNFIPYSDSTQNPDYSMLTFHGTQCSDPWLELYPNDYPYTIMGNLDRLGQYLTDKGITFTSLEVILHPNLSELDLCWSCDCASGLLYNIVADKSNSTKLKQLGFRDGCLPNAYFTYSIAESLPIQLVLSSRAFGADSINWIAKDITGKDTILGTAQNHTISSFNDLQIITPPCLMYLPCPDMISITQIVYNNCGADTFALDIALEPYTSIDYNSKKSISIVPNPSYGDFHFIGIDNIKPLSYQIHDIQGHLVESGAMDNSRLATMLEDGIYVLTLLSNGESIHQEKVIIKND